MSAIARAPSKAAMWYFGGSALSLWASVGRIGEPQSSDRRLLVLHTRVNEN